MSRVPYIPTLALWLLTSLAPLSALAGESTAAGNVLLPRDIQHQGERFAKGAYAVSLESGDEGMWVVLTPTSGEGEVRELAIAVPQKSSVGKARSTVQVLSKDEKLIRVMVRMGDQLYLAYFESAS